jgi:two-component system LytT family sensor kinase
MQKKCFKDVAGFDDRVILLIGWPLAGMIVSLLLFGDFYEQGNWRFLAVCIPVSFIYTGVFWFSLREIYYRVKQRFPTFKDLGKRIAVMFVSFIVVFFIVDFALDNLFDLFMPNHIYDAKPLMEFIATILISSLVIMIYESLSFYLQLQVAVSEKADLMRQHAESQLEGLRNQVNPHFLFNSLNTLIYLIPEDAGKAVRFVQQLSKVYRYVLESRDARNIPLREELEFLQSYVFLQKERFGENLQVEFRRLEEINNVTIVPLSLQILFENAIKHNVISSEKPLRIEMFIEKLSGTDCCLVVRNKLQRKNQVMDSTGFGLQNIKDRYRILTDRPLEIIVSHDYFTVLLPLLPLESAPTTQQPNHPTTPTTQPPNSLTA